VPATAFSVDADLAGGDVSNPGSGTATLPDRMPAFFAPMVRKPVMAAVNGNAVDAGITFALLCDMRVLAAEARVRWSSCPRGDPGDGRRV
jgi:enoyl-CoA hydratase/carnithine racemase